MVSNPPPLPRKRSLAATLLKVWLFFVLLGPALVVGFYQVEKIRGRAAWQAYEKEAKARGVKLALADYIPPQIPDAENFASITIFDDAFRASDAKQDVPDPFKLPADKDGKMPTFADPVKQERVDLAAWQRHFVETKLLPAASENAAADVLRALEKYADPLAEFKGASSRPHCRFPVKWEDFTFAALPQWPLVLSAVKIYALRASAHLALGDSTAAGDDVQAGLHLVTVTREEPSLIAGLVRISCARILENAVWDGLAGHAWADPELQKIATGLAQLDWLSAYLFALGIERGGTNSAMDNVIEGRRLLAHVVRVAQGSSPDKASADEWTLWLYPTGWHYRSKLRSNRHFDEMLTRFDPAQRRWFSGRAVPSSPEHIKDMPTKIRHLLFMLSAPHFEEAHQRFVQTATFTDHTGLACALERFQLARGAFPHALSELAPEFMFAIPAEIVNGEPYCYRRADDGSFVLYSVGTDLHDDGGIIDPKVSAAKQQDWVWRYPQ